MNSMSGCFGGVFHCHRRRRSARVRRCNLAFQRLEARCLLAGDVSIAEIPTSNETNEIPIAIDSDGDGNDLELLQAGIREGSSDPVLDINSDGSVDSDDVTSWLSIVGIADIGQPYVLGDADLDGDVDASDLNSLGIHWRAGDATWIDGDFTGNGSVTALDLNALALHWQHGVPARASTLRVPRAPLPASRASLGEVVLPFDFQLDSTRGAGGDNSSTVSIDKEIDDSVDEDLVNPPGFFTPADPNRGLPIDKNPANDDEWMFLELVDDVFERWPDSP